MAKHARVGQKMGDLNDAELPYLEGPSCSIVTVVMNIHETFSHESPKPPPLLTRSWLSLVNVAGEKAILLLFSPFLVVYAPVLRK